MKKIKVTMNDVAQLAGVSKSTVSHVINDTRFVEEVTRQKVLEVIRQTGYQPSLTARSLTTNQTETIGVILSDITSVFFMDIIRGIEEVIRPRRYSLIVCDTDENREDEDLYLNLLIRQRVDGIIAAAAHQKWDVFNLADSMQIPVVFVDRKFEGMTGPFVGADNAGGAAQAARLLLECGHTRLGVVSGPTNLSTMEERLTGFRKQVASQGLTLPGDCIKEVPTRVEEGKAAAMEIISLPDRPTGLFANNYFHTLGALLAIRELGLRCPEEVALVGFDDHPWASVSDPPLTVIRQPGRQMGRKAAELLMGLIHGEAEQEGKTVMACELVRRKSC